MPGTIEPKKSSSPLQGPRKRGDNDKFLGTPAPGINAWAEGKEKSSVSLGEEVTLNRFETRLMTSPIATRRTSRKGAALVVAMACLVVLGLALATTMKTMAAQHTRLALQGRILQADCLAESAARRAAAQLAADADYQGEAWQLTPADLAGPRGANVTIRVRAIENEPAQRQIDIVAELASEQLPVKCSKSVKRRIPGR